MDVELRKGDWNAGLVERCFDDTDLTAMRNQSVRLVSRLELSEKTLESVRKMVVGHEHELRGLLTYWEEERSSVHVYVVINVVSDSPVGLVSWTGVKQAALPTWWIDPSFRGRGLGSASIEELALEMKRQGFVDVAERIPIVTPGREFTEQSQALVRRLRSHFRKGRVG